MVYLRASSDVTSYRGQEARVRRGDILFATGIWLFAAGFAIIVADVRATLLAVARLKGAGLPPFDSSFWILCVYVALLVVFGVASTLFVLPNSTSQEAAVGLFVVVRRVACVCALLTWR